jgi:hypothetical protein
MNIKQKQIYKVSFEVIATSKKEAGQRLMTLAKESAKVIAQGPNIKKGWAFSYFDSHVKGEKQ